MSERNTDISSFLPTPKRWIAAVSIYRKNHRRQREARQPRKAVYPIRGRRGDPGARAEQLHRQSEYPKPRGRGKSGRAGRAVLCHRSARAAQAAVCTERFHISEAQTTAILIPAGTRVTDASGTLTWETVADAYVSIGETYADVQIRCQTVGAVGNGYAVGQINTFVDLFDYCERCENLTASDDGADQATDDEFYELMRAVRTLTAAPEPRVGISTLPSRSAPRSPTWC